MFWSVKRTICSDCGRSTRHILFDWIQRLPWCADCFKKLLADYRSAE